MKPAAAVLWLRQHGWPDGLVEASLKSKVSGWRSEARKENILSHDNAENECSSPQRILPNRSVVHEPARRQPPGGVRPQGVPVSRF